MGEALDHLKEADRGAYIAVARAHTPWLDAAIPRLSHAANHSKLSIAASILLATRGGPTGKRAAIAGMVSVGATSAITNVLVKPLASRARPDRHGLRVPLRRHVTMPRSHSFPSGHSACAFAFAVGAGHEHPAAAKPLLLLAALVAYSRVYTGVHYPGDTIVGALLGSAIALGARRALPPDQGDAVTLQGHGTF